MILIAFVLSFIGGGCAAARSSQYSNKDTAASVVLRRTVVADIPNEFLYDLQYGMFGENSNIGIAFVSYRRIRLFDLAQKRQWRVIDVRKGDMLRPLMLASGENESGRIIVAQRPLVVMNWDAEILWQSSDDCHSAALGDMDGDGQWEIIAASDRAVYCYEVNGSLAWTKPIADGTIIDIGIGMPGPEVLVLIGRSDHRGNTDKILWKISSDAKTSKELLLHKDVAHMRVLHWPSGDRVILNRGRGYTICDMAGKEILSHWYEWTWGGRHTIFGINAAKARMNGGDAEYLIVRTKFRSAVGHGMLHIFSPEGDIVYEEVTDNSLGVCAVPMENSDREGVLLGSDSGEPLLYTLTNNRN